MDSIHFKTYFSIIFFCLHFLHSPTIQSQNCTKLYYTYYLFRLLMIVCIVLIWFILTVLQESSNLDVIFIVCRKIKNKISKFVFLLTPPPLLDQKPNF